MVSWIADDLSKRGIDSPRVEAEILVAHAIGTDRVGVYVDFDRPLSKAELELARSGIERRRKREPIAYIVGQKEFFGRKFEVAPGVLIPRPETELIIELASNLLTPGASEAQRCLDLCVGSGAIAITLAAEFAQLEVFATDVSASALAIARKNAERHSVAERVHFYEGDLYAPLDSGAFDVITANPPYIATDAIAGLAEDIVSHEPHLALDGGADGLDLVRKVFAGALDRLGERGVVLVEIGADQSVRAQESARAAGFSTIVAHKDLAGIERVIEARV